MTDKTMTLSNGRKVGYAEYGNPDGMPVLYFHGTPSSRIHPFLSAVNSMIRNLNGPGVKIIAVERPGYGLSEPASNYSLKEWANDVGEFTEQLGIDHFSVIGMSGGGPFTLACASYMQHKITKAVIIAGMGPYSDAPELFDALPDEEKQAAMGAMHAPEKLAAMIAHVHANPRGYLEQILQTLPEQDRTTLPQEMIDVYAQMLYEATMIPDGMITDYKIMSEPWDIGLEEIKVPIGIWHSESDKTVPIIHSEYLAAKIPSATLYRLQGPSHFTTMFVAIKDVITYLLNREETVK